VKTNKFKKDHKLRYVNIGWLSWNVQKRLIHS